MARTTTKTQRSRSAAGTAKSVKKLKMNQPPEEQQATKRRYRTETLVRREIIRQKKLCINGKDAMPDAPVERVVREITQELIEGGHTVNKEGFRFTEDAMKALKTVSETFLTELMLETSIQAASRKRQTAYVMDVGHALKVVDNKVYQDLRVQHTAEINSKRGNSVAARNASLGIKKKALKKPAGKGKK